MTDDFDCWLRQMFSIAQAESQTGASAPTGQTMIHHCTTFSGLIDYLKLYPDVVYTVYSSPRPCSAPPGTLWTSLRLVALSGDEIRYRGEPVTRDQFKALEGAGHVAFADTPDTFTLNLSPYEAGVLRLAIQTEKETIRTTRRMSDPVVHQLAALTEIEERLSR